MSRLFALACGFVLSCSAADSARAADPPRHRPIPWHLAMVGVLFPQDQAFESFAVDVQFVDGLPLDRRPHASAMRGEVNNTLFYFGALTDGLGASGPGAWEARRSPGFVFTRWGTTDKAKYVRAAAGGYSFEGAHEGQHVSVRYPSSVEKGTYTFTLGVRGQVTDGPDPHAWVGATVTCQATGKVTDLGALRFDGRGPVLSRLLGAFVEAYGDPKDPKDTSDRFPDVRVAFGNWRVGDKDLAPEAVVGDYQDRVPAKAKVFRWDTVPAGLGDGLDGKMKRGRNALVVVRDRDWPRDPAAVRIDGRGVKDAIGEEVGFVTREYLYPPPAPPLPPPAPKR